MGKDIMDMTREELVARFKPGNPFAEKAARARYAYNQLVRPSAHDQAMASSFPLGGGFGRKGGGKRLDATINRAVKATDLLKVAQWNEAKAAAFDAGDVNSQGRRPAKNADAAHDRREALNQRYENAMALRRGREPWQVPFGIWADSFRQFGGEGRKLLAYQHREEVEKAVAQGKTISIDVLEDYPDLKDKAVVGPPLPAQAPVAVDPYAAYGLPSSGHGTYHVERKESEPRLSR